MSAQHTCEDELPQHQGQRVSHSTRRGSATRGRSLTAFMPGYLGWAESLVPHLRAWKHLSRQQFHLWLFLLTNDHETTKNATCTKGYTELYAMCCLRHFPYSLSTFISLDKWRCCFTVREIELLTRTEVRQQTSSLSIYFFINISLLGFYNTLLKHT